MYYIAGPMRDHRNFNFPVFDEVADVLRARGHQVINPADHDREVAKRNGAPPPEECDGYETGDLAAYHVAMGTTFEELLGWDLVAIVQQCDGIVLLPGWENSLGSAHEKYVAEATGKRVKYAHRTPQGDWMFWDLPMEVPLGQYNYIATEDGAFDGTTGARIVSERPYTAGEWLKQQRAKVVPALTKGQWIRDHAEVIPYQPETTVIGLMGYAQVGKDTLAGQLVERHGFTRIAFADTLRECLYALNPMIPLDNDWVRLSWLIAAVGWDRAKVEYPEVRALLQRLGTEVGRDILGNDIWVETALKKIKPGGKYVITDMRFPNELAAVTKLGGKTVRILREGYGPVNDHWSETALDGFTSDVTIWNSSTPELLAGRTLNGLGMGNGIGIPGTDVATW
jgi:hypothetical protein